MGAPLTLWHYTCDHGRTLIGDPGILVPALELVPMTQRDDVGITGRVVWLTDLDTPIRDALGLTSRILRCDRTAHRYRVDHPGYATRYVEWARTLDRETRHSLELAPGAMPMHWYVSTRPVRVTYDPAPCLSRS